METRAMDSKLIKRIFSGVLAVVFLALGARELLVTGLTPIAIATGGAGLVFLFGAVTGAG